ncbi:MAG: GSU2403 family nucleotidyltransferase fold protein [Acidobacteriaceae bacterium]
MNLANGGTEPFLRVVEALGPWLDQVVVIGGWAHRLYRLHPLAQPLQFAPLMTLDTDVAIPKKLDVLEEDLHTRLEARGFKPELFGEHQPPVTHYTLRDSSTEFYAEFLTPLIGGPKNRGRKTPTLRIAGVNTQKLRYVDLLLKAPWRVILQQSTGFPAKKPIAVQIPNVGSYLVQKILVLPKREAEGRAKDILYIHDTIQTFGRALSALNKDWIENAKPMLPSGVAPALEKRLKQTFSAVTDDIRNAAIQAGAVGRILRPEDLQAACYAGLRQILT